MIGRRGFVGAAAVLGAGVSADAARATGGEIGGPLDRDGVGRIVDRAILPLMRTHGIPGMAVAVTLGGAHHFREYGMASRRNGRQVTRETLFEIGSVSKIFAGTLASYADSTGALSLSDSVAQHLPALRGSGFDSISLLNLGTYTGGDLPLQVPDGIATIPELLAFLKRWKPGYKPGARRKYSNISAGLLGLIAARRPRGGV
ncbi:serine hydrolase [Acidiphilium iwatense]|uniref:serine hydrolase n=1 Tax=Acidiphilium iwatense TaxID=768198 RepID=UPI0022A699EB|nr:serine hydrolase [Acidiphilium iwatense]